MKNITIEQFRDSNLTLLYKMMGMDSLQYYEIRARYDMKYVYDRYFRLQCKKKLNTNNRISEGL